MEHACAPQQLPDPKHQLFIDTTRAPNQSNTMVGFRSLSMLCLMLFASSIAAKQTTVYFSNEKETKSVKVTLNDCTNIDEEDVTMMSVSKKCHVFRAADCMGMVVHLTPGEHSTPEPVDVGSVFCES